MTLICCCVLAVIANHRHRLSKKAGRGSRQTTTNTCPHRPALEPTNEKVHHHHSRSYPRMTATTSSYGLVPLDEMVNTLVAMMGDVDRDFARKVLQYYKGDIDKAADVLLGGEAHTLNLSAPPGNLEGYTEYASAPRQSPPSLPKASDDIFIIQHLAQTRLS